MTAPTRAPQPKDGAELDLLLGWLAYHRGTLAAKCAGLTPEQLVTRSVGPSPLSLLGLVRHLAEMERGFGWWPWSDEPFAWVWGSYDDGAEPDVECTPADVEESFAVWRAGRVRTDAALAEHRDLDEVSPRSHTSLRALLHKLVGEYSRHNGHADLLRERLDGATGE